MVMISESVEIIIQGLLLFLKSLQWVTIVTSAIIFILEVSRGPIHGTVTRELDMNGFFKFTA